MASQKARSKKKPTVRLAKHGKDSCIERRKIVDFGVFGYRVIFIATTDFGKTCERNGIGCEDSDGIHIPKSRGHALIIIPVDCGTGMLAHECYHAVHRMFKIHGLSFKDDESLAYHLGWLTSKGCALLIRCENEGLTPVSHGHKCTSEK